MKLRSKDEMESKFIFLLSYMLALFTADLPPGVIISLVASLEYLKEYSAIFKKLDILINGFKYKFSTAINILASKERILPLRDFLIRFSQALSHGDDMQAYLDREINMAISEYEANMMRKIDSMANFLSIYGTLSSSLIFLMVNLTLVSILFNMGTSSLELLSMSLVMIVLLMTLIVYMSYKPETYVIYKKREKYLTISLIMPVLILTILMHSFISILLLGSEFLALGIYFRSKERKLDILERHYVTFVTYFSRTYSIVNNLKEAFSSILRGDIGKMRPLVMSAYNRIEFGIKKSIVFELMGEESGSVLILMMNRVIANTIEYGGNIRHIGDILAKVGTSLLNIRAKREQNGRAFEASVYALQASSSAIGGTLISLLGIFEKIFSFDIISNIFTLGKVNISLISLLILFILIVISFANGIAITIAYGKSIYSGMYFIGILMIITVIAFHLSYIMTSGIFSSVFKGLPNVSPSSLANFQ
ncbi:MAG: flagellar protein FlaJ [Sulfolobus sp.]